MGILAAIAVPNLFGLIERSRQKIDRVKLFYLQNALNTALVIDEDALYKTEYDQQWRTANPNKQEERKNLLKNELKTGIPLFVFAVQAGGFNVQGDVTGAGNRWRNLLTGSSAWRDALENGGFEGVADIVAARNTGTYSNGGSTYSAQSYASSDGKKTLWRTTPNKQMFISNVFNHIDSGERYWGMCFKWTNGDPNSRSLEVYISPDKGSANGTFVSDQGVCFSTDPSMCN